MQPVWLVRPFLTTHSLVTENQEEIDAARLAGKAVLDNAQPGDCIWDDWNGDGVITYAVGKDADGNDLCDRHEIGNPNPDVMLGVNLGCSWKGFDFAVNGAGAFGQQIMRSYRSFSDAPYIRTTTPPSSTVGMVRVLQTQCLVFLLLVTRIPTGYLPAIWRMLTTSRSRPLPLVTTSSIYGRLVRCSSSASMFRLRTS